MAGDSVVRSSGNVDTFLILPEGSVPADVIHVGKYKLVLQTVTSVHERIGAGLQLGFVQDGKCPGKLRMMTDVGRKEPMHDGGSLLALDLTDLFTSDGRSCLLEFLETFLRRDRVRFDCITEGRGGLFYRFGLEREAPPEGSWEDEEDDHTEVKARVHIPVAYCVPSNSQEFVKATAFKVTNHGVHIVTETGCPASGDAVHITCRIRHHASRPKVRLSGDVYWSSNDDRSHKEGAFAVRISEESKDVELWREFVTREIELRIRG